MKWASRLALALVLTACDGILVIKTGVFAGGSGNGIIIAWINDVDWNASVVSARIDNGYVFVRGTSWDQFDQPTEIRLTLRTTVGSSAQVIARGNDISAEIVRSDLGPAEVWTAGTTQGTGTLRLTTISAEHVEGTFEFVAPRVSTASSPAAYRIARGTFNVPIN